MIPGMYPKSVRRMLIRKSALQTPTSSATPRGGTRMAAMILQMSLNSALMLACVFATRIERDESAEDIRVCKAESGGSATSPNGCLCNDRIFTDVRYQDENIPWSERHCIDTWYSRIRLKFGWMNYNEVKGTEMVCFYADMAAAC